MGIMRALGLILAGFAGIFLALSGDLFAKSEPSGWLYTLLGKQGVTIAVIAACVLVILAGLVSIIRSARQSL